MKNIFINKKNIFKIIVFTAFLILCLNYATNFLHIVNTGWFESWQNDSDSIIIGRAYVIKYYGIFKDYFLLPITKGYIYGIFDTKDNYISVIENDKEVVLKSKILFKKDVKDPIFTMTIKDFKGLEMAGTNTLIEKIATGNYKKGDIVSVSFKQKINVAGGKYTLSFSCTHFNARGELEVLNRKYDALLIEVLSVKDTVGLMRIDSDIKIKKLNEEK